MKVMGGRVIETESERLVRQGIQQGMRQGMRQGQAKMIVEMGQEQGLDGTIIMRRLQEKIGLSFEEAKTYLAEYGR